MQNQQMIEFAPDRSSAGFRLHSCSVYNWGTFHERVQTFSPEGRTAILTGSNGSGKSTMADAVLTLLVEGRRRNYNVASNQSGARKERNEKDYLLGAYSEKHDEDIGRGRRLYLRKPGESYSVLLAYFYNETFQSHVTVAQVLWVPSSGRVERAFIAERRHLTIEGDFNHLGSSAEIRKNLRERGLEPIDTFSAYSAKFHEMLFLPKGKSPMDIFNQAICIKDISNLTQFIRDYMLDDGGAAEKLDNLRKNFDELRLTFQRIENARKQLESLDAIHQDHESILAGQQKVGQWNASLEALPLFFAEKEIGLRVAEAERLAAQHAKHLSDKTLADNEEERLTAEISHLEQAIQSSREGNRLEQIDDELKRIDVRVADLKGRRKRYDDQLRLWQPGAALDGEESFGALQRDFASRVPKLENELKTQESARAKKERQLGDLRQEEDKLKEEIGFLIDRSSNIPRENAEARAFIIKNLGLTEDQLPFVGELVQVKEEEAPWTGAIERLMRNFALCLLVPESLRPKVDSFVNSRRQRGLVVYYPVPEYVGEAGPRPRPDSVASKLEIKPEADRFRSWLERELSHRFDHLCVEQAGSDFHSATAALTLNGMIKQRGSERRKDDRHSLDDRSRYVLGWDNRQKVQALQSQLETMQAAGRDMIRAFETLREEESATRKKIKAAETLQSIAARWEEIDWESLSLQMENLRRESAELKASSDTLRTLHEQKTQAQKNRLAFKTRAEAARGDMGRVEERQAQNDGALSLCRAIVQEAEAARAERQGFDPRALFPTLQSRLAFPVTELAKLDEGRQQLRRELEAERAAANRMVSSLSERLKLAMQRFINVPENLAVRDELVSDELERPGYSTAVFAPFGRLRARILEEDMPKNQGRFELLLHNNVVEEVANFDALLDQHAQQIQRRVKELNLQLREISYDRMLNTFIELAPTRTNDEHQKRFRTLREYALQGAPDGENTTGELKERYLRIEHFLRELEKDEAWTQRVIDVRNWFEFRADEFFRETGKLRQSYSGSSGKSGGEKNRLASTILATAIAYQYGISLDNRQSDTFRLVVVDEMFSKTDDEFSTYLLELFKEFHLQLIIIQPLDSKIHLVQKYVERYHIVTRRGDVSAIRNMTVEEYEGARRKVEEEAAV
jgi:uncharacterized protein YPO0396